MLELWRLIYNSLCTLSSIYLALARYVRGAEHEPPLVVLLETCQLLAVESMTLPVSAALHVTMRLFSELRPGGAA